MGYCNKRRRSKRRRTRTLSAIQSFIKPQFDMSSCDNSSVDILCPSTSNPNFNSPNSNHSPEVGNLQMVPTSIYLDDVIISKLEHQNLNSTMEIDDHDAEQVSTIDLDNIDFDFPDQDFDDMTNEDDDVTIQSSSSSSCNSNVHDYPCHDFSDSPYHSFDRITPEETASYQIMSLLDAAGAPRNCYNRLLALLKKLTKKEGFDVRKAINRETLMRRLEGKFKARPQIQSSIVHQQEVFRFKFNDMLQDLINSSSQHLHQITPNSDRNNISVVPPGSEHELWNTPWMRNTFRQEEYSDFDANKDLMLPIILYMDKTGTDVNQRYSLEPVLFSVAALPRQKRESRHSWRHLGFVPQKSSHVEEDSPSSLQTYHDCHVELSNVGA